MVQQHGAGAGREQQQQQQQQHDGAPLLEMEPIDPFTDDVFAGLDEHPPGLWHPTLPVTPAAAASPPASPGGGGGVSLAEGAAAEEVDIGPLLLPPLTPRHVAPGAEPACPCGGDGGDSAAAGVQQAQPLLPDTPKGLLQLEGGWGAGSDSGSGLFCAAEVAAGSCSEPPSSALDARSTGTTDVLLAGSSHGDEPGSPPPAPAEQEAASVRAAVADSADGEQPQQWPQPPPAPALAPAPGGDGDQQQQAPCDAAADCASQPATASGVAVEEPASSAAGSVPDIDDVSEDQLAPHPPEPDAQLWSPHAPPAPHEGGLQQQQQQQQPSDEELPEEEEHQKRGQQGEQQDAQTGEGPGAAHAGPVPAAAAAAGAEGEQQGAGQALDEFASPAASWHSCMTSASHLSAQSTLSAASFGVPARVPALAPAAVPCRMQPPPSQQQQQHAVDHGSAAAAVPGPLPVQDAAAAVARAATADGSQGAESDAAAQDSAELPPPPLQQQQQGQQGSCDVAQAPAAPAAAAACDEPWQDVSPPPSLGSSPPSADCCALDAGAPPAAAAAMAASQADGEGGLSGSSGGGGGGGHEDPLRMRPAVLFPPGITFHPHASVAASSMQLRQSELVDLSLSSSLHPGQHQHLHGHHYAARPPPPGWLAAHQQLPPAAAQAVERAASALEDSYFFHGGRQGAAGRPAQQQQQQQQHAAAAAGLAGKAAAAGVGLGIRRSGGGQQWSHGVTQPQQDQQSRHRVPSPQQQQEGWPGPGVLGHWFAATAPLAAAAGRAAAGVGQRLGAAGLVGQLAAAGGRHQRPAAGGAADCARGAPAPAAATASGAGAGGPGPGGLEEEEPVMVEHTPDLPQTSQEQEDEAFRGLLFLGGRDSHGRPVVIVNTDAIPAGANPAPRDAALRYLLGKVGPLVAGPYVLVLVAFQQRAANFRLLPGVWCVRAYQSLPRPFRKNVKHVLLLQPSLVVRAALALLYPFVSSKAHGKVKQVQRLLDIELATAGEVQVPHLGEAFLTALQHLGAAGAAPGGGRAAPGQPPHGAGVGGGRTVPVPGAVHRG